MPNDRRALCRLRALARRVAGPCGEADDILGEALLAATLAGRTDIGDPATQSWLAGVIRNRARMSSRGARRRRDRESGWAALQMPGEPAAAPGLAELLAGLPPAQRVVLALAAAGQTRREIAYLLDLSDEALRQRIAALRRHLRGQALARTVEGLAGDLPYGRIRQALGGILAHRRADLGAHDPDGHLFAITASRNGPRRQHGTNQPARTAPR